MPKLPKPSAVVFAKNMAEMVRFYREIFLMKVVHDDRDHVVLETDGFQLVIHGIPEAIAKQIELTDPPAVREDVPIKLCLPVLSIAAARERAVSLGGRVGASDREWEARGVRACDGVDPEGNVIQVREGLA